MPVADGPGDHSDEASSAWRVIRPLVAPATASAIARIDGFARSNPPDDEEGEGDETIGFAVLMPIARMVSGQWGPPKARGEKGADGKTAGRRLADRVGDVSKVGNRRRLPLANPDDKAVSPGDWINEGFWQRAAELREMLLGYEQTARGIYARKGVTDPQDQGWGNALRQCRGDVEWVLDPAHRAAANAGKLRVVERDASGAVRRVMGIDGSADPAPVTASIGPVPEKERKKWGILAAKGNMKLPFVAYSTLPMTSCPGAGGCAVGLDEKGKKYGYCYSFTAWRYPDSFARQFRNAWAEFVDRELAIMAGAGNSYSQVEKPAQWGARIEAAMQGRAVRSWSTFIGQAVAGKLAAAIKENRPAFLRLYVDGDINSEDNVLEWMEMVAGLQASRREADPARGVFAHPGIQVYGYSKCWTEFLALDQRSWSWPSWVQATTSDPRYGGGKFPWPVNYTVNLSSDSTWNNETEGDDTLTRRITVAMGDLPISRGYFKGINLESSLAALNAQFDPATGTLRTFKVPPAEETPFPFNAKRMEAIVAMNASMAVDTVLPTATAVAQARVARAKKRKPGDDAVRNEDVKEAFKRAYAAVVQRFELWPFVKLSSVYVPGSVPPVKVEVSPTTAGEIPQGKKVASRLPKPTLIFAAELSSWTLQQLYKAWFSFLYVHGATQNTLAVEKYSSFDPRAGKVRTFAELVVGEMSRDEADIKAGAMGNEDFLSSRRAAKMNDAVKAALKKVRETNGKDASLAAAEEAAIRQRAGATFDSTFHSSKAYQSKALATALHEVLWTYNIGGSCPLVCGNCYDTPTPPTLGTPEYLNARHRCASTAGFRGATIHIGIH